MLISHSRVSILTVILLSLGATAVWADYATQSINLDQSNTLKDGVVYGSVLIEAYNGVGAPGGGLNAGEVRLTYSAAVVPDYTSLGKTFGIDHVGFNTDLSFAADKISGPAGWKINNKGSMSGFGKFTWQADGSAKGGERPNPVSLLITGLGTDATLAHFLFGSEGNGKNPPDQGSVYFAMHVAGFTTASQVGSHYVGGSGTGEPPPPGGSGEEPPPPGGGGEVRDTPEPSALLLGGFGVACFGLYRWNTRRRKAA